MPLRRRGEEAPNLRHAPTPFGPVALLWTVRGGEPKIVRIVLSRPGSSARKVVAASHPGVETASCSAVEAVVRQIEALLHGEDISFALDGVALDACSTFKQKVLRAEHAIPRGRVSSYGLLAKRVGHPGGGRAVGAALATNPFPLIVPCHRAIRSDGALGGYQGGLKMKRALLEMEGIVFRGTEHVLAGEFYYAD